MDCKVLARLLALLALAALASTASAQTPGQVLSQEKISDTQGGFTGTLSSYDYFGTAVASLGDLDGDGVGDLAVGARRDDDGGGDRGAVWVLFLNADGTVKAHQKISHGTGGFDFALQDDDEFGDSVACLGDLDGDGVVDLAVGAPLHDGNGVDRGAVYVLFLDVDGTVKWWNRIDGTVGLAGPIALDDGDRFGVAVSAIGDFDGDGLTDLCVGAQLDDDGGTNRGAVYVLPLTWYGIPKWHQKISDTQGGFTGALDDDDHLGVAVTSLGDLDGDGVIDLCAAAHRDGDGGETRGSVYVLFLAVDGTVKAHQKISDTQGGFTGALDDGDLFGYAVAAASDVDSDGVVDLAVGAQHDGDGGTGRGAVYLLFLETDGTVASHHKISDTQGGFSGGLDDLDGLGTSIAPLFDLNGDGVIELAVGAQLDDDGGTNRGAVYVLFLDGPSHRHVFVVDSIQSGFAFGGKLDLGPSQTYPLWDDHFDLTGTLELELDLAGANPSGRFVAGGSVAAPDLSTFAVGVSPYPRVDVTGLHLQLTSPPFAVGADGTFDTVITPIFLGGTLTISPSGIPGTDQSWNLSGIHPAPAPVSGTITQGPLQIDLDLTLVVDFAVGNPPYTDGGTFDLTGTVVADYEPLNADVESLSIATGGVQTLYLSTGGASASDVYIVVGTVSGTTPGTTLDGGLLLPLNYDEFTTYTLNTANTPPFDKTLGLLDSHGTATATVTVPPAAPLSLQGLSMHFAYAALDPLTGQPTLASNAEPLDFTP